MRELMGKKLVEMPVQLTTITSDRGDVQAAAYIAIQNIVTLYIRADEVGRLYAEIRELRDTILNHIAQNEGS
jgi:HAMP domain-containing protein